MSTDVIVPPMDLSGMTYGETLHLFEPAPLPSGTLTCAPGKYRRYYLDRSGVITSHSVFDTTGFTATFDSMGVYEYPATQSRRTLVRLTTVTGDAVAGMWFHPHQLGVTEEHETPDVLNELPDEVRSAGEVIMVRGEWWESDGSRWWRDPGSRP